MADRLLPCQNASPFAFADDDARFGPMWFAERTPGVSRRSSPSRIEALSPLCAPCGPKCRPAGRAVPLGQPTGLIAVADSFGETGVLGAAKCLRGRRFSPEFLNSASAPACLYILNATGRGGQRCRRDESVASQSISVQLTCEPIGLRSERRRTVGRRPAFQ